MTTETSIKDSSKSYLESIARVAKDAADAKQGVKHEAADWLRTLVRKLDEALARESYPE